MALTSSQMAEQVAKLAVSKKAEDILVMDMTKVATFADYFVICTANSDTQLRAVADTIMEGLADQDHRVWHSEGYEVRRWILLDYVDVVVHLFLPETRQFYALEKLWGDASARRFEE